MNDNLRSKILIETIRIGDDLLNRVQKDEHGFSWETMGMGENQSIVWNKSEGIYSGVAGIVLFFIELYKQTNSDKYLEAVTEGSRWVEYYSQNNPTTYYALFTGRMGAAYMMLQVGELLKDKSYHQKALLIAEDCEHFLDQPNGIDDLINGTSGTLLGLIHLHAYTKEKSLLPIIKKYTEHLIEAAHIGLEGLYWDRSSKNIRGLCGFSHGVAGIGYVFLELGKYFKNKNFYWLAEQAFTYENHFYNEETENWPDFRKGHFDNKTFDEHKAEYLKDNKTFFTTSRNMSAWCHGAPGIGLSRLGAYELLNDKRYEKDIESAIAQTHKVTVALENINTPYIVCHGGGGNAMLFLEAYRLFKIDKYIDYAEKVGANGLKSIKEHGEYIPGYSMADIEDYSLFMGNAGIGYFYLQLLEPFNTPSIVKPDVRSSDNSVVFEMDINTIKSKIANRYFPKTMSLCSEIKFSEEETVQHSIVNSVKKAVHNINDQRINCIFNYELDKMTLQNTIESDSLQSISVIVELEKNSTIINGSEDILLSSKLVLSNNAKLLETEWDCINLENDKQGDYYTLSVANVTEVTEHELSQFSYVVLDAFITAKCGIDVLNEILEMYELTSEEDKMKIRDSVSNQITEALKSGILIKAKS
jgi:hypothetical protein